MEGSPLRHRERMKRSLHNASLRSAPVGMTEMGKAMILDRKPKTGEGESLTALCVRSKAHWGNDAEFIRLCTAALTDEGEQRAGLRLKIQLSSRGVSCSVLS